MLARTRAALEAHLAAPSDARLAAELRQCLSVASETIASFPLADIASADVANARELVRTVATSGVHDVAADVALAAAATVILFAHRDTATTIGEIREHYLIESQPDALAQLLNLAAGAAERGGYGVHVESSYWANLSTRVGSVGISADEVDDSLPQAVELFGPVRAAVG